MWQFCLNWKVILTQYIPLAYHISNWTISFIYYIPILISDWSYDKLYHAIIALLVGGPGMKIFLNINTRHVFHSITMKYSESYTF